MKRVVQILVAFVVAVAGLGAVSLFVADPTALVNERKDELAKKASEQLGRELTVGTVEARLFPDLSAVVRDVKLAGATAEHKPQLELVEVEVGFSLWKALLSFGNTLEVQRLSVRGLALRAARDREGRWDFDDILQKQAEQPDSDEPADLSFLEGASIARAAIEDGTVEIDDAALGRPLKVSDLKLAFEDVRLGQPLHILLAATFEDGGKKAPLDVDLRVAELPRDLSFKPVPSVVAKVKVAELAVGPWGGLLPADAIAPVDGKLSVDVELSAKNDAADLSAKGEANAKQLVLRQGADKGKPLDIDATLDLAYDLTAGQLNVDDLTLKGTGVDVAAKVQAAPLTLAGVKNAKVDAKVADLGRLLASFPPGLLDLPEELVLEGPLSASADGNAQSLDVSVNADKARVAWAESFDKSKGRALHVTLKGKKNGDRLVIDPFELVVDTATIKGNVGLPSKAGAPIAAKLSSGAVSLASLQSIVPPFKKALERGDKVLGTVAFEANAKGVGGKQQALAELRFKDLDVNLKDTVARGQGNVKLDLTPSGDTLDAKVVADLGALALMSRGEGGDSVLNKPVGMPLDLDVHVIQTSKRADVKTARLRIGDTTVQGKGEATGLDTDSPKLAVDLGALDVAFDDLRRTLPGAQSLPAGGRMKGAVKITGAPTSLATLVVDATAVDINVGESRLKGTARVENLDEPRLDVKLKDSDVRFDDLRPLAESLEALPRGGSFAGDLALEGDTAKLASLSASLAAKSLQVRGNDLRGSFELQDFDQPRFTFDLTGNQINVDQLLEAFGGEAEPGSKKKKADDNPHGLSEGARGTLRKISGKGTLSAKNVIYQGFPMADFVGKLVMTRGRIAFEALDFSLYGGRISAAGTVLDLPAKFTGYEVKLDVDKMDLGRALAAHTGVGRIFSGLVSQAVNVQGEGLAKGDVVKSLTGPVKLTTNSLTIETLDLLGPIFAPVATAAAKTPGAPKVAGKAEKGTTLQDMTAWVRFGDGRMKLEKVLKSATSFGALSLDGGAKLDHSLDFTATAELSPDTIARWTGGKVKPKKAIPVPLKIGGTWERPMVTGVDAAALVTAIMGGAAAAVLGDAKEKVDAKAQAAKAKAEQAAQQAKAQAEQRAQAAKAKAEAEAKKRTAAAKKKAEAEAKKAKAKAEAEANKRAAAAKKKAEEKAKKAKEKAEKEAKRKAEEARKKLLGF